MESRDDKSPPMDWVSSVPFFMIHVAALGVFLVDFKWWYPVVALALYGVRMFGVTAVYHRYFSHRTYKTSRAFQFVLAWIACSSAQKGPLWWAAHHRDHHKYSDMPEDIHSPRQSGFWWSHVGWILSSKNDATKFDRIRDFAKYPELRWLNKYHLVPPTVLGLVLFSIGGAPLLIWGLFLSTVVLWHATFTINSLSHVWGWRRYQTTDDSVNNPLLALITLGEGWHNNHHHYMSSANQGFFWWEIDVSYYIIKMFSWVGLVWDVRKPPRHILEGHKAPATVPASSIVGA